MHAALTPRRLTFDMIPHGGVVLVEHSLRCDIQRRRRRFDVHGHAAPPALETKDLREGDGPVVAVGDQLLVHYDAYVRASMRNFETSRNDAQPTQITLGDASVLPAWNTALPGARVGCLRRLIVPSRLAFDLREIDGQREVDVVFDVHIIARISS
ncbi:unnamed protein product [Agarophyton chilense]